ncbi:vitamin K-dependent protein C [Tachyglossus aculeatus]|uniref:vitamin K-dependent protein C n=1 Tax=Tachyglossus aculeatus TaxID=9261 RepID=UPI0018F64C15|nr:vitamin K-dependent protein C [Tachyglossus aculeatus]
MWQYMISLVFLASWEFPRGHCSSVFSSRRDANQVLRIQKRDNSFLEELKPGNLERECQEELCDLEEAMEIFKTREATLNFWSKYYDGDQCSPHPCNNGACKDSFGAFECTCDEGWEGRLCQYEVSYTNCSEDNGGCEQFCSQDPGLNLRYCSCAPGYRQMDDPSKCQPTVTFPCGRSVVNSPSPFDLRLIDGKKGLKGMSPWQAILLDFRNRLKCGGVLIHPSWVLTAAHCVEDKARYRVRLGEYDRRKWEKTEQEFLIEQLFIHPNYSTRTSDNDIALLLLNKPATFTKYILPICLPTQELAERVLVREGQPVVVTGWGRKENGNTSTFLSYIEIPIASWDECADTMHNAVSKNMLCAGLLGNRKDSCEGDSGGPMVSSYRNTSFLVGLVSWGEGCGNLDTFGVYTKVSRYLDWIGEKIKRYDIQMKAAPRPEEGLVPRSRP